MSLLRRVIGQVLRRVRQRQGRTLREVAEAAGVSLPYLSEVERGRKEASSEVLAAICRALGIGLSDLLEEARDDLRRVERRAPVGYATGAVPVDRVPTARGGTTGPRLRIGFHPGGPAAHVGAGPSRVGDCGPLPWPVSTGRLLHVGGAPAGTPGSVPSLAPIGLAGATGLRVRLLPSAAGGRTGPRTARALARRRPGRADAV